MTRTSLSPFHAALALLVIVVWGVNFVVIKLALGHLPPLTFAALRFTLAAFPALLFVRPPKVSRLGLAAYGLLIGTGQFGLLFIAMRGMISPGLASLVIQTQAFFTIGFAMAFAGERLRGYQLCALLLATAGLGWLMPHAGADVTPLGLALVLGAALSWAAGNTVQRALKPPDMLAFVVWSSLFAAPTLFALAIGVEGWNAVAGGIAHADAMTWAAVAFQSFGNTILGYGVWGFLLKRYSAASVSPLSLLVPVIGLAASAAFLGEPFTDWKAVATALVLGGLALNTFWPMWTRRRAAREAE
jgi:O-acetylserine/cysteine efflux transporter